jgi:colanic acid/amylovoran biosynthesis glycosyltransferase
MGKLCIFGVDDDKVLKDFVRAHVEHLAGDKICVGHWYPDFVHEGKTIRHYYSRRPLVVRLKRLLPHFLYHRWVALHNRSPRVVGDALAAFFGQKNVDVILAEFGPTGAAIAPHAKALGIPLIVHFHGHDAHRVSVVGPLRECYNAMFRDAFSIISVSRYMTNALIGLGCDPEKITTNPYGPREVFFENQSDYRPTFLALGRFTDIKANYLTLMSFKQVADQVPEAKLVMVGDGELLEVCKTLAEVWGISERVEFTGAIPHAKILPRFAEACAFIQHSVEPSYGDAEGTPVVILEAQAAGLPVVSTLHAGIREAVVHGETGFLVEERDVDGMATHMLRLVRDSALARRMGEKARAHIRDNYSLERHIETLQKTIERARSPRSL